MSVAPEQGRGTTILVLGILSLVCCAPLGIAAWLMGSADLKKIQAGVIPQDQKTLTQVGMILGIIGTVFFVLQLLWILFFGGLAVVTDVQPQPGGID